MDEPLFWDRAGRPVDLATYLRQFADDTYRFVCRSQLREGEVVTAWLGLGHSLGDEPLQAARPLRRLSARPGTGNADVGPSPKAV